MYRNIKTTRPDEENCGKLKRNKLKHFILFRHNLQITQSPQYILTWISLINHLWEILNKCFISILNLNGACLNADK